MINRILKTELIDWRKIKPLQPENAKIVFNYKDIEASIERHGFSQPFYVWEDNGELYCIDGHTRIEVLNNIESVPDKLPATFIQATDRKQAIEILIEVYNQKHNPFDIQALEEFIELEEVDVNIESVNISLQNKEDETELIASEDDYIIPDEIQTDIVLGDLFDIGEHRLLCGSSTQTDTWKRLMGDELADLVITDPPYNVAYTGKTKDALTIKNDSMGDSDFYQFLYDFYTALGSYTKAGGAWYVWFADCEIVNFSKAFVDSGFKLAQMIIWKKNSFVMGRKDYHFIHEPCLYGWKEGAAHGWYSDRKQTTVLNFERPQRNAEHPTMKPIPLIAYQIGNSSKAGDIVCDGFGGSGTTMVASEQMKRRCRMIEIDPKYCQVIIDRMKKLNPNLVISKNGEIMQ